MRIWFDIYLRLSHRYLIGNPRFESLGVAAVPHSVRGGRDKIRILLHQRRIGLVRAEIKVFK